MRLDLNLSQSCPWCHWELESFHRIYINIKLDSFRALWAISILLMNSCSSLHCRYYSPEFFFVLFKRVCTLLSFWEQDFLQIHLRRTIYACGFCSESKCTTLPLSFFTKSQVYQSLLPQGLNATFISSNIYPHTFQSIVTEVFSLQQDLTFNIQLDG